MDVDRTIVYEVVLMGLGDIKTNAFRRRCQHPSRDVEESFSEPHPSLVPQAAVRSSFAGSSKRFTLGPFLLETFIAILIDSSRAGNDMLVGLFTRPSIFT